MSHFTAVHTKISNVDTLIECLQDCGMTVTRNTSIRGYNGSLSNMVYPIIGVHDTLEQDLGYALGEDGTYSCHFHSDAEVGALMGRVAQAYAIKTSLRECSSVRGLIGANVSINHQQGVRETV
jgi:hypothetical protein